MTSGLPSRGRTAPGHPHDVPPHERGKSPGRGIQLMSALAYSLSSLVAIVRRGGRQHQELVDDRRVEVRARLVVDLREGEVDWQRLAVRLVVRHRVVCVDNREDAGGDRDLVAA